MADFVSSMQKYGDHVAIIQCTSNSPKKKKKKQCLPRFAVRSCLKDDSFCIEAINMSKVYELILKKEELRDHLTETMPNISWNDYFKALSKTFLNASSNLTLTKGKGGGYMTLSVTYPIQRDFVVSDQFDLSLMDEEEFDCNEYFFSVLESAQNPKEQIAENEQKYDEMKRENEELKAENARLRAMSQNNQHLKVENGQNDVQMIESLAMSNTYSNKQNVKKRKQRDPKMSLMNPRRAKKRKKLKFAGAK